MDNSLQNINIEQVMSSVLKTPGIMIKRDEFLMKNFGGNPLLKTKRPIDLFSEEVVDKRAGHVIRLYSSSATAASAVAGLPGGWGMAPAAFADIVQYYANSLVMIQKLGYIYGWPDLQTKEGDFDEATIHALILYLGVAMGVNAANKFIQELAEGAGKAAAKKIAKTSVTKTLWYPVLKKIMAAFNKKLTREMAQQMAKKAIPILGAVVSGCLTLATFTKESHRLQNSLKEEMQFSSGLGDHFVLSIIR